MTLTLIVEVQLILDVRTCLIVGIVLPQLIIVRDRSVKRFAGRQRFSQLGSFLADLSIAKEEGSTVEVVAPLSVLSALFETFMLVTADI